MAEPAGCPNASLEAMAESLPVLATDVGGMREQIEDGVTGCLVPRGDVAALARALAVLASDRDARERFGHAARERVAARFDVRFMADAYLRVALESREPSSPCSADVVTGEEATRAREGKSVTQAGRHPSEGAGA